MPFGPKNILLKIRYKNELSSIFQGNSKEKILTIMFMSKIVLHLTKRIQ